MKACPLSIGQLCQRAVGHKICHTGAPWIRNMIVIHLPKKYNSENNFKYSDMTINNKYNK